MRCTKIQKYLHVYSFFENVVSSNTVFNSKETDKAIDL